MRSPLPWMILFAILAGLLANARASLFGARLGLQPERERSSPAEDRLLLFWAVGSNPEVMQLVSQNIAHARKFEAGQPGVARPLVIDNYFAHYDLNRSGWKAVMGTDWYSKNVKYSAELMGVKFWLAKDLLLWNYVKRNSSFHNPVDPQDIATSQSLKEARCATSSSSVRDAFLEGLLNKSTPVLDNASAALLHGGIDTLSKPELERLPAVDLATYEYAWLLDEDVLFTGLDLRQMVDHARASNANILSPSIIFQEALRGESGNPGNASDPGKARLEEMMMKTRGARVWGALPPWEAPLWTKMSEAQHCHFMTSNRTAFEDCMADAKAKRDEKIRREKAEREQEEKHARGRAAIKRKTDQIREKRLREQAERRRKLNAALSLGDSEALEVALNEAESDGGHIFIEGLEGQEWTSGASGSGCQRNDTLCELQRPMPSCEYRHTNFVEVSFPLLKPSALYRVLGECPFCLERRGSIWGLDRVWCSMAADSWAAANSSCAVLDQSPVVHLNYKTLPKWNEAYRLAMNSYNWGTFFQVMDRGRKFWAKDAVALSCRISSTSAAEGEFQQDHDAVTFALAAGILHKPA